MEVQRTYKPISIILAIIAVSAIGAAIYFYLKAQHVAPVSQANAQKDAEDTIAAVGELIVLPQDEVPTVATVTDLAPLKDQPFFAHATIGDKVLIYQKAAKAILYDPRARKIVEVAPINIGNNNQNPGSSSSSAKTTQTPSKPKK